MWLSSRCHLGNCAIFFRCSSEIWQDIGFSFGVSIAVLYIPLVISSKVSDYLNFKVSDELVELREALSERVRQVAPERVEDSSAKSVVKEVSREKYSSMFERARRIEESVYNICHISQIVMFVALIILIVVLCRGLANALGPFVLVHVAVFFLQASIAKYRFSRLVLLRCELEREFHKKDPAYQELLKKALDEGCKDFQKAVSDNLSRLGVSNDEQK